MDDQKKMQEQILTINTIVHKTLGHIKVNCGESPNKAKTLFLAPTNKEVYEQFQFKKSFSYKRKYQLKDKIE